MRKNYFFRWRMCLKWTPRDKTSAPMGSARLKIQCWLEMLELGKTWVVDGLWHWFLFLTQGAAHFPES